MRSSVLALILLLSGCAGFQAGVPVAIEKGRAAADTAAQANLALTCAVTVGAYFRLENPNQQRGIGLICSPGQTPLPE